MSGDPLKRPSAKTVLDLGLLIPHSSDDTGVSMMDNLPEAVSSSNSVSVGIQTDERGAISSPGVVQRVFTVVSNMFSSRRHSRKEVVRDFIRAEGKILTDLEVEVMAENERLKEKVKSLEEQVQALRK